jgi:hypothetical protein
MGSLAPNFLRPGKGQASSPITSGAAAAAPAGGAIGQFRTELGTAMSGRVSLLMLDTLILGLVLFYIWTKNAQGGG